MQPQFGSFFSSLEFSYWRKQTPLKETPSVVVSSQKLVSNRLLVAQKITVKTGIGRESR